MPRDVALRLFARPEPWSARDHEEWMLAIASVGLAPDGDAWRTLSTGVTPEVRVRVETDPARGVFAFHVPRSTWWDAPASVARTLRALVHELATRVDLEYGTGPTPFTVARPRHLGEIRGLDALVILGPALAEQAGSDRLDTLPGFAVEGLANGAMLLRLPFKGLTAGWSPDKEARLLDAEMHLRLPLDPARFPTLHGPAESYLRRREGAA